MRRAPVLLMLFLLGCAITRAGALDLALDNYMKGEYADAVLNADNALTTGTPSAEERARATLIKAQSFEHLGRVEDAIGLYRYLVEAFPASPEAYQATEQLRRLERSAKVH